MSDWLEIRTANIHKIEENIIALNRDERRLSKKGEERKKIFLGNVGDVF